MELPAYPIPVGSVRLKDSIKRSRFVVSITHTATRPSAKAFIENIRRTFPDANHHCWAHVAGRPGDTSILGFGDDGEPQGTAGKPMLNILLHTGIGEITAVVTRYFGGIKLGKGGLVRAYSGMVQKGLAALSVVEKRSVVELKIGFCYAGMPGVHRVIDAYGASIVEKRFDESVSFTVAVAAEDQESFIRALRAILKADVFIRD